MNVELLSKLVKTALTAVFQVRGDVDFFWALAAGPGAEEWQSPPHTAVLPESNQDIRCITSLLPADIPTVTMTSQLIRCHTVYPFRNHAVQWVLSGQHRNYCIWSQSPWRKGETLIHWLCGTYVSIKITSSNLEKKTFVTQICLFSAIISSVL